MKHSDDLLFIFHTQRGDDTGVECPGLNDMNANVVFFSFLKGYLESQCGDFGVESG